MMIKLFGQKSDVERYETELSALAKQRAALEAKAHDAGQQLEAARADRRDFLTGADVDNSSARSAIDKRVQSAESLVAGYRDALGANENRASEARANLSEARERSARETAADACDAAADKIANSVVKVDDAIQHLAAACRELRDVIPRAAGLPRYGSHGVREEMSADEAVAAVIGEALYNVLPDLFEVVGATIGTSVEISLPCPYRRADGALHRLVPKYDDSIRFLPASGAADANLVKPLRQRARAIRAGEIAANFPIASPLSMKTIEPPPFEMVEIVFVKPSNWIAENGQRTGAIDSAFNIPKPIAERAIALRVGFPKDSDEARAHLDKRKRWHICAGDSSEKFDESVDLGIDLEKMIDAERARLNGWPAPDDNADDAAFSGSAS